MVLGSLLLLLLAGLLHASANVLMKRSVDKMAFTWWMLGVYCVLASPSLFFIPNAEAKGWLLVVLSGTLEATYFVTLTRAYTTGDLSLVYPVARGSAPLFLLLWAIFFLGERPTWAGIGGIAAIVSGLYLINLTRLADWSRPLHAFGSAASRWALLTGLLISVYSAIDKAGVRYFPPYVYVYLILLVCWILLSLQWLSPARRPALLHEIRNGRVIPITIAAICGTAGYGLVLAALRISPVSYVGPVREISVVFGAWIGIRFLGEQGGSTRIAASILVVAGIVLISIFG